jgi:hypothetical protein
MPQNPVSKREWEKVKEALMEAHIPFTTTWDSHWDGESDNVTYDERITVMPFTVQHERKITSE